MVVYISVLIFSVINGLFYDKNHRSGPFLENLFLFLIFAVLFIISGFRYNVGVDYSAVYYPVFFQILKTGNYENIEKGYVVINKVLQLFTNDPQSIFIFVSFFFILLIIFSIRQVNGRGKSTVALSVFIFVAGGFYFYSFNVMRQCLTIAMFIYSIRFIKEKRFFPYLIINLLGGCIHTSAFLYIPLYFFFSKNYKRHIYILIIVFAIVFRNYIFEILTFVLDGTKYENYLTGLYANPTKLFNASQILNIILFIAFLIITPKRSDKLFYIFRNIHFAGLIFTLFMGAVPLIFRVTTMFYNIQFLSVPYLYSNYLSCSKAKSQLLLSIIFVIYLALFINSLINNANGILPYEMNI